MLLCSFQRCLNLGGTDVCLAFGILLPSTGDCCAPGAHGATSFWLRGSWTRMESSASESCWHLTSSPGDNSFYIFFSRRTLRKLQILYLKRYLFKPRGANWRVVWIIIKWKIWKLEEERRIILKLIFFTWKGNKLEGVFIFLPAEWVKTLTKTRMKFYILVQAVHMRWILKHGVVPSCFQFQCGS